MCCNKYTQCADTGAFHFDNAASLTYTGTHCTTDFLDFVGKSNFCHFEVFHLKNYIVNLLYSNHEK